MNADPTRSRPGGHGSFQEPVSVARKGRMIPHRLIGAQTNKPAEQKVNLQAFHQLMLRADRIKACNSIARSSFSGAIEDRPMAQ